MIKIEKGIPGPISTTGLAHEIKPMEIGDSFFIANRTDRQRGAVQRAAGELKYSITSQKVLVPGATGEDPVVGIRFWRVATGNAPRKYVRVPKVPARAPAAQ